MLYIYIYIICGYTMVMHKGFRVPGLDLLGLVAYLYGFGFTVQGLRALGLEVCKVYIHWGLESLHTYLESPLQFLFLVNQDPIIEILVNQKRELQWRLQVLRVIWMAGGNQASGRILDSGPCGFLNPYRTLVVVYSPVQTLMTPYSTHVKPKKASIKP